MRIVLDAMGSDTYPRPEVQAAFEASERFEVDILLVGQEEKLKPLMAEQRPNPRVHLVHAPEVLEMGDKPARSARRKSDNSMAVGMDLVKAGEGQAFVTAGNTGGAMVNALFRLGRIRGVKRPGLTTIVPTKTGHAIVVDIGANADCKPLYLFQFGVMGSIYAERVLGTENPRVGLLSNGEEKGKGNQLVKDTYSLFEESALNFFGNAEPKELFGGEVDVIVSDGFTGNVLVKSSEAVSKLLLDVLKDELTSTFRTKMGAALALPAFKNVKQLLDPREFGAAPLLGIDGLVFVGHGRSDALALVNAIRGAKQAVDANLLDNLKQAIQTQLVTEKK
ncbi:MAG: phosphate acyltransferase PlsX [Chloroflexota bacterium]|nr:phosphate acyltransferase PlsX [Chloroflexota bacterium]